MYFDCYNIRTEDNNYSLRIYSNSGYEPTIIQLIKKGASIHVKNSEGKSALDIATEKGNIETKPKSLLSQSQSQSYQKFSIVIKKLANNSVYLGIFS